MPYFSTEIDIDIDDFLSECSSTEINELIEKLQEDGHISKSNILSNNVMDVLGKEWSEVTDKLNTIRFRLSLEDEELIKKIVNLY